MHRFQPDGASKFFTAGCAGLREIVHIAETGICLENVFLVDAAIRQNAAQGLKFPVCLSLYKSSGEAIRLRVNHRNAGEKTVPLYSVAVEGTKQYEFPFQIWKALFLCVFTSRLCVLKNGTVSPFSLPAEFRILLHTPARELKCSADAPALFLHPA